MFVEKVRIVLTDQRMKIIEGIHTILLFTLTVLRLALSFNDGEAKGLLVLWAIWIFVLGAINFMGAIGPISKYFVIIFYFPPVMTRTGRGVMFMFLTFPMITKSAVTIVLGVLILVFGLLMIALGWNDKFEIEFSSSS
jgi:hypothetical protein